MGGIILKKIIIRAFTFGLPLGLLMFVVGKIFHLSTVTLLWTLILSYIVFIAIMIPYYSRKKKLLNHKIDVLLKEMNKGNIEQYIEGMEKLFNEEDNAYVKAVLAINVSVGYTLKGDFEQAIAHLEQIDINSVDKRSQMVLYHNIASNAFWAGEIKKACVIMELHQNILQQGLQSPYFKNSFGETFALWFFAKGKREEGFAFLENIMQDKGAKALQRQSATVIWIKEKIADKQIEQALPLLNKIFPEIKVPYLKKEAEKLLIKAENSSISKEC